MRETVAMVMEWVAEQVCHAFPVETNEPVTVAEVVVPQAVIDAVIAEAEIVCEAAAIVEEATK